MNLVYNKVIRETVPLGTIKSHIVSFSILKGGIHDGISNYKGNV